MVETGDRRQKLEVLLERVRRNRRRLADEAAETEPPEDLAAPAAAEAQGEETAPLSLPVTGAELLAEGTIELEEGEGGLFELEGGEDIDEEAPLSLEAGDGSTGVIELTVDDEVTESAPPPRAGSGDPFEEEERVDGSERPTPVPGGHHDEAFLAPELPIEALSALVEPPASPRGGGGPKDTLVTAPPPEHEPERLAEPAAPVAPWPSVAASAEADTVEEAEDDEPEIEISYGTEEAMALSAELGLSEAELEAETHEDLQLHPADLPTPRSLTPGRAAGEARPAPDELLDLPAPPLEAIDLPAPPSAPDDLPGRPAASPADATPTAERWVGAEPPAGAAVAEVLSEAAPVRPRTLGELLRAALSVGRAR